MHHKLEMMSTWGKGLESDFDRYDGQGRENGSQPGEPGMV